jgi:hypothetical protein
LFSGFVLQYYRPVQYGKNVVTRMTYFDRIVQFDQYMMNAIPQRVVIYAKDVENITGMKNRTARRLLEKVRKHAGKTNEELITVYEFCQFTGISEAIVWPFIIN